MAGFDSKEYVKERYEHLKKCYGAHDPYVQGYAECMRAMEQAKPSNWKQAFMNTFFGGK